MGPGRESTGPDTILKSKFEFISGRLPVDNRLSGITFLYNSPEYLTTFRDLTCRSFYIRRTANQAIEGSIHFQIKADKACSIYSAPFGSFTLSTAVDLDALSAFMDHIEDQLKNEGITELLIRHYPAYYAPVTGEMILSLLGMKGYGVRSIDINQYLIISQESFHSRLHPMERRKLKKCEEAGFIFKEYPNTDAELVFKLIGSFRKAKGIPVNINKDTLNYLVRKFPDNYKFYSVQSNKEIIAATICVGVSSGVLYNFLPADDPAYRRYSPMVYLAGKLYELSRKLKYRYLDLGVSSLEGNLQEGLARFKERLGAKVSGKFTFSKNIH